MARLDESKKRSTGSSRISRFGEILGAANPETKESKKPGTQKSGIPDQTIPKREDPSFQQCSFRIPRKLSRQLDRLLLDLADDGEKLDRSDLLITMAQALLSQAEKDGAQQALKKFKNLGTQESHL